MERLFGSGLRTGSWLLLGTVLFLCTATLSLAERPMVVHSQAPVMTFNLTTPEHETLIKGIQSFAQAEGFSFRLVHLNPLDNWYTIYLQRVDLSAAVGNIFDVHEYRADFYAEGSRSVPDEVKVQIERRLRKVFAGTDVRVAIGEGE
jgi:hypothetical protein